jgi:hypothetical protein
VVIPISFDSPINVDPFKSVVSFTLRCPRFLYDVPFMKRLTLALFTLVITTVSWAQQPAFTLEQVMSSPFPTALTAAAKANRIAWVFNSRGERNV